MITPNILVLLSIGVLDIYGIALPQEFKTVKGQHSGQFVYNASANLNRFQEHAYDQHKVQNLTNNAKNNSIPRDYEKGVCYIEVPTVSLVKDQRHVPAGNGSHPEYSRIRVCCKGYIRNIHNYKICDPVCTEECINGLCIAPDTCSCFPDHVQNLAGFCIPKCPIGCQNGVCMDGECVCKRGYRLEAGGQYCVPICDGGCGGLGNCTEPNICSCKKGYESLDGSCMPKCDHCVNGNCIGPNNCVCRDGYYKNELGECTPICPRNCPKCSAPNVCECGEGMEPTVDGSCRQKPKGCPEGYAMSEYSECVPTCPKGCDGGVCTGPNFCSCSYPLVYNETSGKCQTNCSVTCINGGCVYPPDICSCNPGYIKDKSDPTGTRCIPHCPSGCPNGFCSAPNFCLCTLGYVKDRGLKGSQACVKRNRRSAALPGPLLVDVAEHHDIEELLTFLIPDDE